MLEPSQLLEQHLSVFQDVVRGWNQATGKALAFLSPQGDVIAAYGQSPAHFQKQIVVSGADQLEPASGANLRLVPLMLQDEVAGYLLAESPSAGQESLLDWLADFLTTYLTNEHALEGMTDELIAAWNQLDLVYRITQTLAEQPNLTDALHSILQDVVSVIRAETGFILLEQNDKLECVTVGGQALPELVCQPTFVNRLTQLDHLLLFNNRRELLQFWPDAPEPLQNFIGTYITSNSKNTATLGLLNKKPLPFNASDVKLVTAISEQLGAVIDNYQLQQELIARERVERELEIAAEIQDSLLPKNIPHVPGLSIDVSILPAYEVGGDFYDFIAADPNQLTIILGDVAGKGIPAAMFTSMVRTMLKTEAYHSQEPHIILKRVNDIIAHDLWQAELFITAFVATFDTKNNVLLYASAGHIPGIIYHAQSKTSRLLKATSLPLGVTGYAAKITQYVHLSPGDTLVLFSDGITDTRNPQGEYFGLQRVQNLIHQHADKSPSILKQIILRALSDFSQTDVADDDIALTVAKFLQEEPRIQPIQDWKVLQTIPFQYKADTIHLVDISRQVTHACRVLENLPSDSRGDDFVYLVELAVSEICTNMIEHAYADTPGYITGQITLTNLGVQIDIYDQGRSFNPDAIPPPISDPMDPSEGGYGLHIVRQIMDIAEYEANTPQGNHWRLVKYLPT